MSKTMNLSLSGSRSHCVVHCVGGGGMHEDGYNLFIIEASKRYGLRPITGVYSEGGFKLTDSTKSPVVKLT